MIGQGDVYWTDLPPPRGSGPGYRRPVVIVQADWFNRSRIRTVIGVPLTSNLGRADSPGNVMLPANVTGLPYDSVANVSLTTAFYKEGLLDPTGNVGREHLDLIFAGIDIVLGR